MVMNVSDSWSRPDDGGAERVVMSTTQISAGALVLADAVYERWCAAIGADQRTESAWLVEVSHALRRASRAMDPSQTIG